MRDGRRGAGRAPDRVVRPKRRTARRTSARTGCPVNGWRRGGECRTVRSRRKGGGDGPEHQGAFAEAPAASGEARVGYRDAAPTFRLRITDAAGRTAADVCTTATSGTGARGTFDATIPHRATCSGAGLPAAHWNSMEGCHPVVADTVPLTVTR
ncbi:Gmad2 immunoglobulin-like domain-containing protein [Streptomyces phaeochromogenes]